MVLWMHALNLTKMNSSHLCCQTESTEKWLSMLIMKKEKYFIVWEAYFFITTKDINTINNCWLIDFKTINTRDWFSRVNANLFQIKNKTLLSLLNSLTSPIILNYLLVWLKLKISSTLENWKISILIHIVWNALNLLTDGNWEEQSDHTSTDFIMLTRTETFSSFRSSLEKNSKLLMKNLVILLNSTGTNLSLIKHPSPTESDSSTLYRKFLNSFSKFSSLFIKCFWNLNSWRFLISRFPKKRKNLKIKDKSMISSLNLSPILDVSINFIQKPKLSPHSSSKFTNTFRKWWWNLNSNTSTVKPPIWMKQQCNKLTIWGLMLKRKVMSTITQNHFLETWTVWSETLKQDKPERKWKRNSKEES